jgi:rhodanese-related sulfurtransferase
MQILNIIKFYMVIFTVLFFISPAESGNLYKTLSAASCDSLIRANDANPDFVILDVRTPSVWLADHLTASINRDYYDANFNNLIGALPKNKMYLLHCQSGSRSAATFTIMQNLNFATVYQMSGGISAWKNAGFPTTSGIAPRLMLVSLGGLPDNAFRFGTPDTLNIIVTNRGNDILKFKSFTLTGSNETTTDFYLQRELAGAEDYKFTLIYKALQVFKDSVRMEFASNGGNLKIAVPMRAVTGNTSLSSGDLKVFPNPAGDHFSILTGPGNHTGISLFDAYGRLVRRLNSSSVPVSVSTEGMADGVYFVKVTSGNQLFTKKLVIKR